MDRSPRLVLTINRMWDGTTAVSNEWTEVAFALTRSGITVTVDAQYHNDPPPDHPPGRTDGLWNYEVVELFVANESGEYLELELGPHGNYLAILFSGIRDVARRDIVVSCQTTINGSRWRATAHVDPSSLPLNISRANAYAIHGQEGSRRFLAASPLPGTRPDFHQPHFFRLLQEIPLAGGPRWPEAHKARFLK